MFLKYVNGAEFLHKKFSAILTNHHLHQSSANKKMMSLRYEHVSGVVSI